MFRPRRRPAVRPAARVRAAERPSGAESLEVRRLLTTYTVTTGDDVVAADGEVSLREALQAAETNADVFEADAGDPGRDVITFADDVTRIDLNSALPALSESIVIDGRDAAVTLDAGGAGGFLGGILTLSGSAGGTFSLSDLRFVNGAGAAAGAVFANSGAVVLLDGVDFAGNTSAAGGGAVTVAGGSTVSHAGGVFELNGASGGPGGAAVQVLDGAYVGETLLFQNNAVDGIDGGGTDGGAVFVGEDGNLNLTDVRFDTNRAVPGADGSSSRGGAVFVAAGGSALLKDATFVNNGAVFGGAVYSEGELGVRGGDFRGNFAALERGRGGAVFSGAGFTYLEDVSFVDNTAATAGGAVEVGDARVIVRDFLFSRNRADENAGRGFEASPGNGGAVHVSGAANVGMVDGRFQENFAASQGGAVWNSAEGELTLRDVTATDNEADGAGADEGGGAVYNDGGTLRINDSAFARNLARGSRGSGGALLTADGRVRIIDTAFGENVANRAGGAVEIIDGRVTFVRSRMLRNEAGPRESARPGNGGAVHVGGNARTILRDTRVTRNFARAEGGGLWNSADGRMTLDDVALSANVARGREADQGGGGLYNDGGRVDVRDSFVGDNDATGDAGSGGGILSVDGRVKVEDSNFARNTAVRAGGAIEVVDGRVTITESNLLANDALGDDGDGGNGGALHVTGTLANVVITGGAVARNDAAGDGGGLWNQAGSRMRLRDVRVRDNAATGGGGVWNNGGRLDVEDGTRVDDNVAESNGGGIYNASGGEVVIEDSRVRRNVAGFGGGMFLARFSEAVVRDAVFSGNSPDDVAGQGFLFGDDDGIDRA